jgi:putative transcriptional regulator
MSERFESLKAGLEDAIAWKEGQQTGARVHVYSALDVAAIRKKTKMTQKLFSDFFQIPLPTLRQWEQGQRVPQGPAQALLKIIDRHPDLAKEILST